ncbi:MAG: flagellar hook-basal body complex protein FliE [Nitrospirae bacterium]|nr:flagellar hook-basal body complex protein FliE [Nitrospirota bacterium]
MDDIRIKPILPSSIGEIPGSGGSPTAPANGAFLGTLKEAIAKVNEVQVEASQSVDKLMTGENQNVHQTMIALQKADVSFQLMMQIRNKIVTAYEEIQRMQV